MHLEGDKKIWKILTKAVFCLVLFFCFSGIAQAATFNPAINYQGKLTKPNNALVPDDDYNMKFRLCDDASCTVEIWSETRTSTDMVLVANGLFSVMLGDISDISAVNFNQTLFLEVSIGGTSTPDFEIMLPRKKFGAVPAAFEALKLGGKASSEYAVLANNESVSGTWQFIGTTTLATTSVSFGSKIGDMAGNYMTINDYPISGTYVNGSLPMISFISPNFQSNSGGISQELIIVEDSDNPGLIFAPKDFSDTLNLGKITYSTSTNTFIFQNPFTSAYQNITAGNVSVQGNLTLSGLTDTYLTVNSSGQMVATTTPLLVEADPEFNLSFAHGITSSTNWDTAYTDRLKWDGGDTGLNSSTARTNLGVAIGTDVQAYNASLAAIAGGTWIGSSSITTLGSLTALNVAGTSTLATTTISGNLGIGTIIPDAKLVVDNGIVTDLTPICTGTTSKVCTDITSEDDCNAEGGEGGVGCSWADGSCSGTGVLDPGLLNNQTSCETYTGFSWGPNNYNYQNSFKAGLKYTDPLLGDIYLGGVGFASSTYDGSSSASLPGSAGLGGIASTPGTYGMFGIGKNGGIGGIFVSTDATGAGIAVQNLDPTGYALISQSGINVFVGDTGFGGIVAIATLAEGTVYSNSNGVLSNVAPSSESYKDNITTTTLNIDALLGLQVKSFNWKSDGRQDFGLIAEEIQNTIPEIYRDNGTVKGYLQDHLPFYLLQIAQRQNGELKFLDQRINDLLNGSTTIPTILSVINNSNNNLATFTVTQSANFFGTITVIGEAGFTSKVTFSDHVYFDKDSAGTATIIPGATSTEVIFGKLYETIPIINITAKANAMGRNYWVENETTTGFRISVDDSFDNDFEFNWQAVAIVSSTVNEINNEISSSMTDPIINPSEVLFELLNFSSTTPTSTDEDISSSTVESSTPDSQPVVSSTTEDVVTTTS